MEWDPRYGTEYLGNRAAKPARRTASSGYRQDLAAALGPLEKAIAMFQPGGEYGKGLEVGLERGKKKAVAGGMQSMVSAGLAGTTMPAGLGMQFEEEVAAPARASLEESRMSQLASLYSQKSNMVADAFSRMRELMSKFSTSGTPSAPSGAGLSAPSNLSGGIFNRPRETGGSTSRQASFPNIFGSSSASGYKWLPDTPRPSEHNF